VLKHQALPVLFVYDLPGSAVGQASAESVGDDSGNDLWSTFVNVSDEQMQTLWPVRPMEGWMAPAVHVGQ
jgi:hypothetical protein